MSPRLKVHLGIFRPGLHTLAGTVDSTEVAVLCKDRHVDIDRGVDGAAHVVVAAIDLAVHTGFGAAVVHVGLIDIAWREDMVAVCSAEEIVDDDGGAIRHVHLRASGDTLVQTAAVGSSDAPAHQVDDGGGLNQVKGFFRWGGLCGRFGFLEGLRCRPAHTQSVVSPGTEHLSRLEILEFDCLFFVYKVWYVDKHIAVILRLVTVAVALISLAGTEDALYRAAVVGDRSEIDEGIVQIGLAGGGDTGFVCRIGIVIVAKASAKDIPHPTLRVLHVGRGLGLVATVHHVLYLVTDAAGEICIALDAATQVVAAIDMVADPGEARHSGTPFRPLSHVGLSMSEDIGITRSSEGVEHTSVAEAYMGVAGNDALEAAAVDELTLRHVGTVTRGTACHARGRTIQIDVGAVLGIIVIFNLLCGRIIFCTITDSTCLTATENLEHIAFVQVDGGAAPDLRLLTIAAAKHVEG